MTLSQSKFTAIVIVLLAAALLVASTMCRAQANEDQTPKYTLEVSPTRIEIEKGGNATAVVTVRPGPNFKGSVDITVAVYSKGIVSTVITKTVRVISREENRSAIIFHAEPDCPVGNYTAIVSGRSGIATSDSPVTVTLVVIEPRVPILLPLMVGLVFSIGALGAFWAGSRIGEKRALHLARPILAGVTGLRSARGDRETNEDSAIVKSVSVSFRSGSGNRLLLAVADGMGGHKAGELASAMCVKIFSEYLYPYLESSLTEKDFSGLMNNALLRANSEIRAMASERPEAARMGTTFVGAVAVGDELHVAWVGDSRAYLIRGQRIFRLTRDHSKVQEWVDQGRLSPEEARVHPDRNIVTRSVGLRAELLVGIAQPVSIVGGDIVVLCSDGVTDLIGDNDICRVVLESSSPQQACDRLLERCARIGVQTETETDNATVIVAALKA
jgi:serine/threonine protein phosphatase PrpC